MIKNKFILILPFIFEIIEWVDTKFEVEIGF
jgi:hypothetical protein